MPGSHTNNGDDWDLPEQTPTGPEPTSLELPPTEEPIYDTGSDGWWRQQAAAQRAAAEADPEPPAFTPPPPAPLMPPLELVEPEVLNLPTGPSPFDEVYQPDEPLPLSQRPVLKPLVPPVVHDETPVAPSPPPPVAEEPPSFLDAGPAAPELEEWDGNVLPGRRIGAGRALAWAGLAVAGVGLLVIAFLLLGKDEPKGTPTVATPPVVETTASVVTEHTAEPTPEPTVEPTTAPPAALAPIVPLTVLNNSKISHLAERSAAKFRAGGWPVPATGNYRGHVDTTTIYYPPGQRASAERFGKQFGVRVLPRFATLPGSGMTVVVTRDFA